MDIYEAFAAMNKISLVAFLFTLIFIGYEFKQLLKSKKNSVKNKPIIPSFTPGLSTGVQNNNIRLESEKKAHFNINTHLIIFILLLLMCAFFAFVSISSVLQKTQVSNGETNQVNLQEVQSSGIKVFDSKWQEIKGDTVTSLNPGTVVYIGIAMIKGADIDEARIRINSESWTQDNVTKEYKNDYNVFYKPYIIKEGESKLVIEAQLHSKSQGWLAE